MRTRFALLASLLAFALLACGGAPAVTDPYQLTSNAMDSAFERIQVNIGVTVITPEQTITISPDMMVVVIDTAADKGRLSVQAPLEAFGLSRGDLMGMGADVDRFELDMLFDSEALYARIPIAAPLLAMMFGQFGEPIEGDLGGWLRLASKEDLDELAELGSAFNPGPTMSAAEFAPFADLDPAELQAKLEASGITLIHEGSVTHDGVDAEHISIAVDYAKFVDNPLIEGFDGHQLKTAAQEGLRMSADIWFERATSRPLEATIRGSATESSEQSFVLTMLFSEPDPAISLDAPDTFVDLPILELYRQFMPSMFGG